MGTMQVVCSPGPIRAVALTQRSELLPTIVYQYGVNLTLDRPILDSNQTQSSWFTIAIERPSWGR